VPERPTQNTTRLRLTVCLAVALAIVIYGGYGGHWSWTGINGKTASLWDWLHLLLLPIAVALLPLLLSRTTKVDLIGRWVASVVATVFIIIVVAGYLVPWGWTGFKGNSLWDWLNLLALPVVVALAPLLEELRAGWSRRHSMIAVIVSALFVAVVLAGYLLSWRWTGFTGNTAWDWLHLLLLPLLLPLVIVPALKPMAEAHVELIDEPQYRSRDPDVREPHTRDSDPPRKAR
jgi:hypothetical protein